MKYVSIYKLKSVASVALATFALSAFAALPEIPLTSQMAGAVLLDKTIYTVSGTVEVDARMMPGMSALRVPIGAETVIRINANSKLIVYGGPGYGIIGGGAGIEVPAGAKLVVCGDGQLFAHGGSPSLGGAGYGGRQGMASAYTTPDNLPDGVLPCPRSQLPSDSSPSGIDPKTFCDKPLKYCRAGCGGEGGEGGGGGGAGIGGRGGWGGVGGQGGLTRCVVPSAIYNADGNAKRYQDCETFFSMTDTMPIYVCDMTSKYLLSGSAGTSGDSGLRGSCSGDVVVMGNVTVEATASGLPSNAKAKGGSVGATANYGDDQVSTPMNLKTGLSASSAIVSGVGGFVWKGWRVKTRRIRSLSSQLRSKRCEKSSVMSKRLAR